MITRAELHRVASSEGIRFDQAEKDYVILWMLHGLSHPESRPPGWILKGGTCLRHCYYPGYRFSDDLDYTCQPDAPDLDAARSLLERVANRIREACGVIMHPKAPPTIPGDFQVEIPVEYSRGGPHRSGLPCVRVHLTFDEPVLTEPCVLPVTPHYSDLPAFTVVSYTKPEVVAEKMRALLQQHGKWPRPRDLYDLWYILGPAGERFPAGKLGELFMRKCAARAVDPDPAGLISNLLRGANRGVWASLLGPLMKAVADFDDVWRDWLRIHRELFG